MEESARAGMKIGIPFSTQVVKGIRLRRLLPEVRPRRSMNSREEPLKGAISLAKSAIRRSTARNSFS